MLGPTPANATNWRYVSTGNDDREVYIDDASLKKTGNIASIWIMFDLRQVKTERARTSKELWKFDCVDQSSATVSVLQYDANGQLLLTEHTPVYQQRFQPIAPETIGAAVMKIACM
jgi:hypothetical protein